MGPDRLHRVRPGRPRTSRCCASCASTGLTELAIRRQARAAATITQAITVFPSLAARAVRPAGPARALGAAAGAGALLPVAWTAFKVGALVAFFPSFAFVLAGARYFGALRGNSRAQSLLDGATPLVRSLVPVMSS